MNPSHFKAKRVTRSYCQTIHATPEVIFSLLCPVKEKEWLDGWQYTMIYSESGYAEEGCVFLSHQEGEKDTIWLITERDVENKNISFARITPGSRAAKLTISVKGNRNEAGSKVHITYTFTALSEEGNHFIDNFTEEAFNSAMKFWERSMNYYLDTGKKLGKTTAA